MRSPVRPFVARPTLEEVARPQEGTTPLEVFLTPREADVYQYVRQYCLDNLLAPTTREVAARFGFAHTRTREIFQRLVAAGAMRGIYKTPRAYRPVYNVVVYVADPKVS